MHSLKLIHLLILLPAAVLFTCDLNTPVTKTFYSNAALDGEVNSSSAVDASSDEMNVGDLANNATNRGFVSFDISSISPAGYPV
jgi:hypothetical protein